MDTIDSIIKIFKSFKRNIKFGAQKIIYKQDSVLIRELAAHSPVDSGYYASRWRAGRVRFGSGDTLAALRISNDTPGYGQFMEAGAPQSKSPWYFPHRSKKSGRFESRSTGKLKISGGRVWAGGLSPGHDKTVGGAINIVMGNRGLLDKITIEVSDELVKGFT